MNIFDLRQQLIDDYAGYVKSFIAIRDARIRAHVDASLEAGLLWPEARLGLNPSFAEGGWIDDLVEQGILHDECGRIFRIKETPETIPGRRLRLHRHQLEAIHAARTGRNYVLTTGTGSGKSLSYIVPIVDHVLRKRHTDQRRIQAIVVYPMNALANSQEHELEKFLQYGYPEGRSPVRFARYTGQESEERRHAILADPPDILLTNYVMLELILTRTDERRLVAAAHDLRFLVFDELHTYRGRQGADVALLARRVREACAATQLQLVGTSATMATSGSFTEQRQRVAEVASLLFGAPVDSENVIGETLRRATPPLDDDPTRVRTLLRDRLANAGAGPPVEYGGFIEDPLSRWIEGTLGMRVEAETGRLVRVPPKPIGGGPEGIARTLADLAGLPETVCATAIQRQLLAGAQVSQPETGFPVFAFRLHQFISRGDTAYATLEPEATRYITVNRQTFVPGDRHRLLYSLAFCRECGHEYYVVRLPDGSPLGGRRLSDPLDEEPGEPGFLYFSEENPWPDDFEQQRLRIPESWLETARGTVRLRSDRKPLMPRRVHVQPDGVLGRGGIVAWFVPAPFRFCLSCGISYGSRQRSDFSKLATLGSEGRSTATTILSLSVIRRLRREEALGPEARKLLSFTDNRQDAALQAGHFNDFIEVGLLRSALYRAVSAAGVEGILHEALTQRVFDALGLPLSLYATDPEVRFVALQDTRRALREVIGYRLYRDLRRGWRITQPNLEQCGLLRIGYRSLDELAAAADIWQPLHPALAGSSPEKRADISKTLLDWMRRNLAIKVDYLNPDYQERLQQLSNQRLRSPWAIDENERLEHAAVMFPRSKRDDDYRGFLFLSSRGAFGQYLRRQFPGLDLKLADTDQMIPELLKALKQAGLVEEVRPARSDDPAGYQVPASAMVWLAGNGTSVEHDPLTILRAPPEGRRTNQFFVDFYRTVADDGRGLEAREHTAQVRSDVREERENRFKTGDLPILFCSPTMELGVDIRQLNVVNLRNVPPTPANYAQRSGRAGRSGQPALVFTYCSTGSSHDQYFFRRQELMVSGQVAPPRIDLLNEDLTRAHVHAIWLAETGMSLGSSLRDILDLGGDQPTLALLPSVRADVDQPAARPRARLHTQRVLGPLLHEINARWGDTWLDDAFASIARRFEEATDRWRTLYRAALAQAQHQTRLINDASRPPEEKQRAKKLRREAEAQVELLLATAARLSQSDFYSYRYFASEGFLPGYSFPRLPLSAFIPGRRTARGEDEYLSRPRFLAISEFGPRNFIYHEGSRYIIYRAIFPVEIAGSGGDVRAVPTQEVKRCEHCGYLHDNTGAVGADVCDHCRTRLGPPMRQLFRMQNVTTVRRDRITSDEEERQRLGYEIRSGLRFAETAGRIARQLATVQGPTGETLATLSYGHTATLWRINYGWRRRRAGDVGFVISVDTGEWAKRQDETASDGETVETPLGKTERVTPYVDDRRNCLLIEPRLPTADTDTQQKMMAGLQAALKNAVQVTYQLEDAELAAEPLPDTENRRYLLLYESAEGGAGVLRRLVETPLAFAEVARTALELCHFDPQTGADQDHAPNATERCEAACYDCLMSYGNQPDHRLLDRTLLRDVLLEWAGSRIAAAPGEMPRSEHLLRLERLAASDLERRWLRFVYDRGHRLPSDAAVLIPDASTRPDFTYEGAFVVVYIDGPHHQYPERAARDRVQTEALRDLGYTVVRFAADEDWETVLSRYPSVFGPPANAPPGADA